MEDFDYIPDEARSACCGLVLEAGFANKVHAKSMLYRARVSYSLMGTEAVHAECLNFRIQAAFYPHPPRDLVFQRCSRPLSSAGLATLVLYVTNMNQLINQLATQLTN